LRNVKVNSRFILGPLETYETHLAKESQDGKNWRMLFGSSFGHWAGMLRRGGVTWCNSVF
jgi:hypothetical protein